MLNKEETVGYQIRTLSNLFKRHRDIERARDKEKLSSVQAWTIGFLFNNEEKDVFQKDIEKEFDIRRPTATALLQGMEKKGLIKKSSVGNDRRLKKIVLTPKGREMHLKFLNSIELTETVVRNGITDEQIKLFFECVNKMKENLIALEKGENDE